MRIIFVERQGNDRPAHSEISEGVSLADAITHAKVKIENFKQAETEKWSSVVVGFVIYDDDGRELYRKYE